MFAINSGFAAVEYGGRGECDSKAQPFEPPYQPSGGAFGVQTIEEVAALFPINTPIANYMKGYD